MPPFEDPGSTTAPGISQTTKEESNIEKSNTCDGTWAEKEKEEGKVTTEPIIMCFVSYSQLSKLCKAMDIWTILLVGR